LRILAALSTNDHSATTIAQQFGEGLTASFVFYHLTVLEKECGAIELIGSRPVKGCTEHFFRLIPAVFLCDAYSELPAVALSGLRGEGLRQFVDLAAEALDAGALGAREETTFAARPAIVDRQGLKEISDVMEEALKKTECAERKSRRRLLKATEPTVPVRMIVGAAAFEVAQRPAAGLAGDRSV
jgi:hypothetical protein